MVKLEELKGCTLLKGFTEEELRLLADHFDFVKFEKGELLFDEFDPPNCFYLVKEGRVGLFRSDNFGRWTKVAAVYGGAPLGECAFFLNSPHSLRAVAETPVKAFRIDRSSFEALKEENPSLLIKFLEAVLSVLSERLKSEDRKFSELCGFFSVPGGGRWKK